MVNRSGKVTYFAALNQLSPVGRWVCHMLLIQSTQDLAQFRERQAGKNVGFVPTMGALHEGHLSLVRKSLQETDQTVVSIFVNPTQFNQQEDLENYPRTLDRDLELLEQVGCHAVFLPSVEMLYPNGAQSRSFNFGTLDQLMEGSGRPGHFEGMATVVTRFFELLKPQYAYFGEKDFQQLCIVQHVVEQEGWDVTIVPCSISREPDGLAMSSRNMRLTAAERKSAGEINKRIRPYIKELKHPNTDIKAWEEKVSAALNTIEHLSVEYVTVCFSDNLQHASTTNSARPMRVFVAVRCGIVRLIDNYPLD